MSVRRFEEAKHAKEYLKHRPVYNEELFQKILVFLSKGKVESQNELEKMKFSLAIDVGCGSGQSIKGYVDHFDRVIGCDVSPAQIDQANSTNTYSNVEFRVSEAEKLPAGDGSVDLLTAGMALHWFDHPRFYEEVDRILRPGGVIAVYMMSFYFDIVEHGKQEELSTHVKSTMDYILHQDCYWHERDNYLLRKYTDLELQIPYVDTVRDESMTITIDTTIENLFSYLQTRSGIYKYLKANGKEGQAWWQEQIDRFCEIYGCSDVRSPLKYKFDIVLLMGRKP